MLSNYISSSHRSSGKTVLVPASQLGQKYHFAPVLFCPTTIVILSYTKMVKIAASRSVFSPKIHHNAFAAPDTTGRAPIDASHPLDAFGISIILSVFGSSNLDASTP